MKRRNFLYISTLAAGSLSLMSPVKFLSEKINKHSLTWKIYEDGSFDIVSEFISLLHCYPSIDQRSIATKSFKIDRSYKGIKLVYELIEGFMELILGKDDDSVFIETTIQGTKRAPMVVNPIGNSYIVGASKFFKQGLGFGGPSGMFEINEPKNILDPNHLHEQSWSYDSYLCTALIDKTGNTLSFGAYEHKNFLQRTTLYNNTHSRGLIDAKNSGFQSALLSAGFLTEQIPLSEDGLKLPSIHFIVGNQPFLTLQQLAKNIFKTSSTRTNISPMYHWDSWNEYHEDFDSVKLNELVEGLKTIEPIINLKAIIIDAGYCLMGDWMNADPGLYPSGLEPEVKKIIDAGYKSGIYIAPFMVSSKSLLYNSHPDWLLKSQNGNLIKDSKEQMRLINIYLGNEDLFYLDTSHPEVMEYLRNIFRTFKSWGVTFFKLNFLDFGFQYPSEIARFAPGKTSVQYFRESLDMIRDAIGDESYILSYMSPFAPMIGVVDATRVALDLNLSWTENSNNIFNETLADQYFNNIFWQNDPDVVILRQSTVVQFTDQEIQTIALWNGMLGGIVSLSDNLNRLEPERLKLWRFIQPSDKTTSCVFVCWFDTTKKFNYLLKPLENNSYALLVVNTSTDEYEENVLLSDLAVEKEMYCFDWESGKFTFSGLKQGINCKLNKHESKLYYLSRSKQSPISNMNLSGEITDGL